MYNYLQQMSHGVSVLQTINTEIRMPYTRGRGETKSTGTGAEPWWARPTVGTISCSARSKHPQLGACLFVTG
jgi:hypothetical protein